MYMYIFISRRRRQTRSVLVTGVQTCAPPIYGLQCGGGIAAAVGFAVAVVGDVVRIAIARGVAGRFAGVEPAVVPVAAGEVIHRPVVIVEIGDVAGRILAIALRSEEHTSELQSLMRSSYAVFCLQKKNA